MAKISEKVFSFLINHPLLKQTYFAWYLGLLVILVISNQGLVAIGASQVVLYIILNHPHLLKKGFDQVIEVGVNLAKAWNSEPPDSCWRRFRWRIWIVVIVVLLIVGIGVWVICDSSAPGHKMVEDLRPQISNIIPETIPETPSTSDQASQSIWSRIGNYIAYYDHPPTSSTLSTAEKYFVRKVHSDAPS